MRKFLILKLLAAMVAGYFPAQALQVVEFKPHEGDMTPAIRKVLENPTDKDIKLVFAKGTYSFHPDKAIERFYHITNHDDGDKKIIFYANNLDSIEIEGNGSSFIFHEQCAPFIFQDCKKVRVNNLSIDWDIPYLFQGEITKVNAEEGWWEARPLREGYSWKVEDGNIVFPLVGDYSHHAMGHTYAWNPESKDVAHGASAMRANPKRIEERKGGILRFHDTIRKGKEPPIGAVFGSKGHTNRYAPAVYGKESSDLVINGVVVHHALGMGFLFERSTDIALKNGGVYIKDGSDRVISAIADATHFSNCKGHVLLENLRIEGMMDDGTNVHGTHVSVAKVIDAKTLRIKLEHRQQQGNIFAVAGDEIWFIHQPSTKRKSVNTVVSVKKVDATYSDLTFKNNLPGQTQPGDVLENKTWNPTVTVRGCSIGKHRARNLVFKSPLKIVVENNKFISSDLASILFRGETFSWFESGAVQDVTIRNNHFTLCNRGGNEQAVVYITPRHGKAFNQDEPYDRNIRFINNTIETFGNRIIWADRAENLLIKGNTIIQTKDYEPLFPDSPVFEFVNCLNATLIDNTLKGDYPEIIRADDVSKTTLKVEGNKGFALKAVSRSSPTTSQPNIVLFFVDDMGWADLGYRQPDVFESPNIDALAAKGIDFEQTYIACPTCSPSRSTLVTGKHPARLEIVRHIPTGSRKHPEFDQYGRTNQEYSYWETDPAKFPVRNWLSLEHTTYAEALKELGYYNLFVGKWHLGHEPYHPDRQGWDRQIGTSNWGHPKGYNPPYFKNSDVYKDETERYLTDKLTDETVQFIDDYDMEKPFMISLWYYNVHGPFDGKAEYVKHFKAKGLENKYANYAAMVKSVDDSIGRIRGALEKKGIAENTIIIFLSDQGGAFNNPPFHGGKSIDTLYEGGARVPFIFHWPGVTKDGAKNDSIVQSTDLFPTLVEIAGGDPATFKDLDGVSLKKTIMKNSQLDRGEPIVGYRAYQDLYASVREGDWKLLAYRSGVLKLYNIAEDIGEKNDVAESNPEKVSELKAFLAHWEKEMKVEEYSGVQ
ncbi:MAG: sulfatase-like hydrolase/transferase [Puniceicoccaceae bacterium]